MIVRPCRTEDLGPLVELAAGFHDLHRSIAPEDYRPALDKSAAAAMFAEIAGSTGCLLAVADAGSQLAGYVWGQLIERPDTPFTPAGRFLFLHQLFVSPDWRRAKVASALLEGAASYGRAAGAREVYFDVVLSNSPALGTFASHDFRASGVIMRRPI